MSLAGYARKIKGGCLWNMKDDLCNKRDTLLVSLLRARALYLDFIFQSIAICHTSQKFLQYKTADGSIGDIAEIFLQLFRGKFRLSIWGKYKIPEVFMMTFPSFKISWKRA